MQPPLCCEELHTLGHPSDIHHLQRRHTCMALAMNCSDAGLGMVPQGETILYCSCPLQTWHWLHSEQCNYTVLLQLATQTGLTNCVAGFQPSLPEAENSPLPATTGQLQLGKCLRRKALAKWLMCATVWLPSSILLIAWPGWAKVCLAYCGYTGTNGPALNACFVTVPPKNCPTIQSLTT